MQYCSDADVLRHLPSNLPDDFDTAAERLPFLQRASQEAQELLLPAVAMGSFGGVTQMFPDQDDDPATPESVRQIVARIAAIAILGEMGAVIGSLMKVDDIQAEVDVRVDRILDGRTIVMDSDGTMYARGSIATTVEGTVPVFTMGRKDADGNLVGDSGSTDGFVG